MHNEELTAKSCFLAGPLGFEPRQSAPKALDLPLVDGPVIDGLLVEPRAGARTLSVNNPKSTIKNSRPVRPPLQRHRGLRRPALLPEFLYRSHCRLSRGEHAVKRRTGTG